MRNLTRSLIAFGVVLALLACIAGTVILSAPRQSQAAGSLSLTFTCAQAVDNVAGQVCVHTSAGAALTIKVKYCSGYYSTTRDLKGTRYADASGNYTWTWKPQTTCLGPAVATVKATLSSATVIRSATFTVQ